MMGPTGHSYKQTARLDASVAQTGVAVDPPVVIRVRIALQVPGALQCDRHQRGLRLKLAITRPFDQEQIAMLAEAGVPCWIGGMVESGLGISHCLAAATLSNIRYPNDISASSRFFAEDLIVPPITMSGPSRITASDQPGVGCTPDPDRLERFTVERVRLRASAGR